jgi:hypothetical protein
MGVSQNNTITCTFGLILNFNLMLYIIQLEAAISIPVRPMVNVALNLEANYVSPWNTTQFYAPGSLAREDMTLPGGGFGITRRRAYMTMETIMSK